MRARGESTALDARQMLANGVDLANIGTGMHEASGSLALVLECDPG